MAPAPMPRTNIDVGCSSPGSSTAANDHVEQQRQVLHHVETGGGNRSR